MKKPKYQLNSGEICKKAAIVERLGKPGWLHYELVDGTIGLARPGTWSEISKTSADRA